VNFIEQLFGASPDGGSGMTELLIAAVMSAILSGVGLRLFRVRWIRASLGLAGRKDS
jgi:hypothetical protein